MDWTLEVVILPVSDIDRAVAFYRDQVGFDLDHDTTNEHMHVVQLTPRGSGCSIVLGDLRRTARWSPVDARPPALRRGCGGRPGRARIPRYRGERLTSFGDQDAAPSSDSPTRRQHLGGAGAQGAC